VTLDKLLRTIGRPASLGILIALMPAAPGLSAQQRAAVGAQAGYSRADLIGEASDLVASRQGAITGVYLHVPLNSALSMRPEVLFSLRGGRTLVRFGPDIVDVDIELAYLELPLLARVALPRGRLSPVIFGGPSFSLQIGCDFLFVVASDSTFRETCGQEVRVVPLPPIREWELGWVGGVAVDMRLPRTTLSLQGRYYRGFRSFLEGNVDLRNRGMAVLFGLTF
jgi:hypothetical protein